MNATKSNEKKQQPAEQKWIFPELPENEQKDENAKCCEEVETTAAMARRGGETGLHLPISSMASLHLAAGPGNINANSGNADHNGSSSKSQTTKAAITTAAAAAAMAACSSSSMSGVGPQQKPKRAGFSLPLTIPSNLLPNAPIVVTSSNKKAESFDQMRKQLVTTETSSSAQSKRCRFAVKDSSANQQQPSFHTSTSSNASTVIEQPQSKLRRSRSPGRKQMENGGNLMVGLPVADATKIGSNANNEGIEFRAPLMIEQAEELMLMAKMGKTHNMGLRIIEHMPNKPRGGTMFLLNTATFDTEGNQDGYMWTEILHQSDLITSKENHLDYRHYYISTSLGGDGRRRRTSSKFRREAYTMGDLTLVTYIGDENEASMDKPPPPPVSLQATTFHSLPRSHRYDKRPVTASEALASNRLHRSRDRLHSSALNVVQRPHSLERSAAAAAAMAAGSGGHNDLLEHELQLRRLQALRSSPAPSQNIVSRLSHPAGIQEGLIALSEELAAGKLVKNLTLFPALQITLVHPDMTREFEHACQVLYNDPLLLIGPSTITQPQDGMRLFYDITFPLGRLFVTILTFVNACYEGHPIMPLAINIHERQFKSSHSLFWARVVGDIPALQKHRFPLMIDDAEPAVHLAVRAQAPNLVQLEGWSHRFRDIDRFLRTKGYGEEAINYYKACVCYLLNSPSKQAMHDRFRKEFEYVWPKDFVLYYRQRLLPRSGRLGRWAMAKLNICENSFLSPHANPQERFFKLVNGFRHWESLSLQQMIRAFNYLFVFFINELSLRDTGNGAFVLKTAYQPHFHKFHHPRWQNMIRVPHPTEISAWVARQHPDGQMSVAGPGGSNQQPQQPQFRPSLLASSYTADTTAFGESFDDVHEMEEALDRLFRESEEEDVMFFDELIRPTFTVFNSAQKLRQAKFHQSSRSKDYSSSFSSNVPSPAPNGQVPSPAPEDQLQDLHTVAGTQTITTSNNVTITTTSSVSSSGGGTVSSSSTSSAAKNTLPRNSALSTIPEVSSQREGTLNNLNNNNNYKNIATTSQPPDLIVHSTTSAGNWQEHSFDSSIVTEGHYDASFESEVLPVGPVATTDSLMPHGSSTAANLSTSTVTANSTNSGGRPRPPPLAHSAKKSVFSVTSLPSVSETPPTTSIEANTTKPSSLMLWKKVQHYVVVGGAFVSSAATANNDTNEPHQRNPQDQVRASKQDQ